MAGKGNGKKTEAQSNAHVEREQEAHPAEAASGSAGPTLDELKARAQHMIAAETAAFDAFREARAQSADAEHELCMHIKQARSGDMKRVEIELGGVRYKPKLISETQRYRLDRVLTNERVTL